MSERVNTDGGLDRLLYRTALAAFVDRLDAEFGAADPAEVERFRDLLAVSS